ncbi:MAG: hypothetical protein AAF266_13975 [Planctomycetota bacterium]
MSGINMEKLFGGMGQARMSRSANYLKEGRFIMHVRNCKVADTERQGPGAFIEMTVLAGIGQPAEGNHSPGEEVSQAFWQRKQVDTFLPNLKAFLHVCLGVDPEEIDAKEAIEAFPEEGTTESPLADLVIELEGVLIKTKGGNDFNRVKYLRVVPYGEVKQMVEQDSIQPKIAELCFPGDALDKYVEFEAQAEAQAAPAEAA